MKANARPANKRLEPETRIPQSDPEAAGAVRSSAAVAGRRDVGGEDANGPACSVVPQFTPLGQIVHGIGGDVKTLCRFGHGQCPLGAAVATATG